MKYTKGPWAMYSYTKGDDVSYQIGNQEEYVTDIITNKADAQLIAAAPELLEACKALLIAGEEMDGWYEAKVLAKQAINQAKGK